jgi:glycosyltransferase involved in cell wall biosynthesis
VNRATILIPTTGAAVVRRAIESCLASTYAELQVIAVVDGSQHEAEFRREIADISDERLQAVVLPENVGKDDYYGHRIYGGFSHLVNAHYLLFLDQDNFIEPDHVARLIATIEKDDLDWAYSLRKICAPDGTFMVEDNCESLGRWPSIAGYHLVDTNCYCLKLQTATSIAVAWFGQWAQDRRVTDALLKHFPNYSCSGAHTMNYRVREATARRFFEEGNARMGERYPDGLPWMRTA